MSKIRDNSESGHFRIDSVLVWEDWGKLLGPYGFMVYAVLVCLANNETQECWPSYQFIADKTGMSRRQISREIRKLVKYNLIEREQRRLPGKKELGTNLYRLLHYSDWQAPPGGIQPLPSSIQLPPRDRETLPPGDSPAQKLTSPFLTNPKRTKTSSNYKFITLEELERERVDPEDDDTDL